MWTLPHHDKETSKEGNEVKKQTINKKKKLATIQTKNRKQMNKYIADFLFAFFLDNKLVNMDE